MLLCRLFTGDRTPELVVRSDPLVLGEAAAPHEMCSRGSGSSRPVASGQVLARRFSQSLSSSDGITGSIRSAAPTTSMPTAKSGWSSRDESPLHRTWTAGNHFRPSRGGLPNTRTQAASSPRPSRHSDAPCWLERPEVVPQGGSARGQFGSAACPRRAWMRCRMLA